MAQDVFLLSNAKLMWSVIFFCLLQGHDCVGDSGYVATVAGNRTAGYADGLARSTAMFNVASGVVIASYPTYAVAYVVDQRNHRIRRIFLDDTGIGVNVTTVAGNGTSGFADGAALSVAMFNSPTRVDMDPTNPFVLFVCDAGNNRIRRVSVNLNGGLFVTTVAGNGSFGFADGFIGDGMLRNPRSVCVDPSNRDTLYVADRDNYRVRKVTLAGAVGVTLTTVAGNGTQGFADGDALSTAMFNNPTRVAVDWHRSDVLFVADSGNNRIRRVSLNVNGTQRGLVTTLAGTGASGTQDGAALTIATFSYPTGLAVDPDNPRVLYVADWNTNRIRRIVLTSVGMAMYVTTVAGNGTNGFADGPALATAMFSSPYAVVVNPRDTRMLFVSDFGNNCIRRVLVNKISVSGTYSDIHLVYRSVSGTLSANQTLSASQSSLNHSQLSFTVSNTAGSRTTTRSGSEKETITHSSSLTTRNTFPTVTTFPLALSTSVVALSGSTVAMSLTTSVSLSLTVAGPRTTIRSIIAPAVVTYVTCSFVLFAGATGTSSAAPLASRLQVSSSSSALRRHCPNANYEDSEDFQFGTSPLENPLQLTLTALPSPLESAGGALLGNIVAVIVASVASSVVLCLSQTDSYDWSLAAFLRMAASAVVCRFPGTSVPSLGLLLQPSLCASVLLVAASARTWLTIIVGVAGAIMFGGIVGWMSLKSIIGIRNGLVSLVECAPLASSLLFRGDVVSVYSQVALWWTTASSPQTGWIHSSVAGSASFVASFGPCFEEWRRSWFVLFDCATSVAASLAVSFGFIALINNERDCHQAIAGNWALVLLSASRFLVALLSRPFHVPAMNAQATAMELMTLAVTLLNTLLMQMSLNDQDSERLNEAAQWLDFFQGICLTLSCVASVVSFLWHKAVALLSPSASWQPYEMDLVVAGASSRQRANVGSLQLRLLIVRICKDRSNP